MFAAIADGAALEQIRKEHEAAAASHDVWGVPTFIVGDQAAFVRLMHASEGDAELARRTVERVVDLVGRLARAQRVQAHQHPALSRRAPGRPSTLTGRRTAALPCGHG